MSAWIKLEKSIETDPRVLRMAKALDRRFEILDKDGGVPGNAWALPAVTLVCGALARLWVYADTHARSDDTLDLGLDEVDELVGIPGFSRLMPEDWLVELGPNRVELPGFQAHNGVEAKKRALTQKRVAKHRQDKKRDRVTPSNASALPDQDQDQTKTRPDHIPHKPPSPQRASAGVPRGTITKIRALYPKGTYRDSEWLLAEHEINRRLDDGEQLPELVAAASAYAMQQQALGKVGTQYVLSPAKFFNGSGAWRGPFPTPAAAEHPMDRLKRLNGLAPAAPTTTLHPPIDVTAEPEEHATDARTYLTAGR